MDLEFFAQKAEEVEEKMGVQFRLSVNLSSL